MAEHDRVPDEFNDSKKAVVQIGSVQGSHENALTSGTVGRILQAAARMTIDGNPQSAKDWENLRVGTALETGKLKPMVNRIRSRMKSLMGHEILQK